MRLTEFTEAAQSKTDDNMRTYMALKAIEKKMHAQGIKGARALEFLRTSLLDIALNAVGREKRAGYEPHVLNVKNWDDAKEFLMTAYRDGREQGVAEGWIDSIASKLNGKSELEKINDRRKKLGYDPILSIPKKQIHPAYDEGFNAGSSGWGRNDNPYLDSGKPAEVEWDKGWTSSKQGVAEGDDGRDKHYYLRNNIWRIMDGDELVHEYTPARYEVPGAKKLLAQFDDEGYDVTHVISPMGTVTYLYGKPEEDMDEGYRVVPGYDREKYQERPGLEGPFHTKSGKVVYYDKKEGSYYDPDTDMFISYEDWQAMNEAGFGRATGRASWDSNMPGYQGDYGGAENWGRREREDDEHHEIDRRQEQQAASGTWYITIDGKLLKNKEGQPFTFVGKAAATKAAQTMMAKPFNQGKKFMLTTKGV